MTGFELQNVLLIEDDAVDVKTVRRALKRNEVHFSIHVSGDGVAALELLRSGEISLHGLLILLDLNMPRMGGLEFLDAMRKDPALLRIPTVVMTTSNADSDRLSAYASQVAGYVVKPVTFDKFSDAVSKVIGYWSLMQMP